MWLMFACEGCLCKRQYMFPCTVFDIQPWFLQKVLQPIWPMLKTKSLIILGEPGRGKTPIGQIIAMAVARYWSIQDEKDAGRPCFRITSDIDFLRGVTGDKTCVDIVDYADCNTIPVRKFKSIADVGSVEAMSKERWNAVKWVMNQLRMVIDNKYSDRDEPQDG